MLLIRAVAGVVRQRQADRDGVRRKSAGIHRHFVRAGGNVNVLQQRPACAPQSQRQAAVFACVEGEAHFAVLGALQRGNGGQEGRNLPHQNGGVRFRPVGELHHKPVDSFRRENAFVCAVPQHLVFARRDGVILGDWQHGFKRLRVAQQQRGRAVHRRCEPQRDRLAGAQRLLQRLDGCAGERNDIQRVCILRKGWQARREHCQHQQQAEHFPHDDSSNRNRVVSQNDR